MTTSLVTFGLLSLVLALGGVACDPVIAGSGTESSTDPPAETASGVGGGGDNGSPVSAGPIVTAIAFNGSGCRDAGSASVTVAPEGGAFLVTYASMALAYSPDTTTHHLNCAVGLTLEGTAKRRLRVIGSSQRGVAQLPAGTSGTVIPSYFFAGNPVSFHGHSRLEGPYNEHYAFSDTLAPGSSVESTCGEDAILTINTSLNLSATSSASMDVASAEVAFTWDKC